MNRCRSALIVSGVFATFWLRAIARAARALMSSTPIAGTVGLWRPRVVFAEPFTRELDAEALAAARLHEEAHVRHRDPLRIWLGQMITDLQWPWPSARHRLTRWRHVLELARDEEARLAGADGADLAAAILSAAQLHTIDAGSGAMLVDGSIGLEERVNRLLAPMSAEARVPSRIWTFAVAVIVILGILLGMQCGDTFVQAVVRWL